MPWPKPEKSFVSDVINEAYVTFKHVIRKGFYLNSSKELLKRVVRKFIIKFLMFSGKGSLALLGVHIREGR